MKARKMPRLKYDDATVAAVMVGNQWFPVVPGTWTVNISGPFHHASWLGPLGHRYSAFISHTQMVRHIERRKRRK